MPITEKIDFFKQHKAEYAAGRKPAIVSVGPASYLAVIGKGEPGGAEFQDAIGALYAVAWTMKMARKFAGAPEYKVCALEGVYQDRCDWRLMIRVPEFIKKPELSKTVADLIAKGKPEAVRRVELARMKEGRCSQVMQVGPYSTVCQTTELLRQFEEASGVECAGPLHEIYLSDPRRVPPEKLRTIVRRPVRNRRAV